MSNLKILFSFILSIFFIRCVYAETYYLKNFSVEDGLSQSQVTALFQDKNGLLWIGTLGGGVSVYNGKIFQNYTSKEGLINNYIIKIIGDSKGNIWIATFNGISKFNLTHIDTSANPNALFQNFSTKEGLINNTVRSILEDKHQNIWFGTAGGLVKLFEKDNITSFQYYTMDDGLIGNNINSLCEDKNGNIYVGTNTGLSIIYFNEKDNTGKLVIKNYTSANGLSENRIACLYTDQKGKIWIGTDGKGVSCYSPDQKPLPLEASIPLIHYNTDSGLVYNRVWSIIGDNKNNIWFGTFGGGISIGKTSSGNNISFENITTENGLVNNNIRALLEDREGNIWIGMDVGGLTKFGSRRFAAYTKNDGLNSDVILSVCQDAELNFWFGTWKEGVSFYNISGKKNKKEAIKNFTIENGLINNTVWGIIKDKSNNLWFGTEGGLSILKNTDILKRNYSNFINIPFEGAVTRPRIWTIIEDVVGNIWIGTDRGTIFIPLNRINTVLDIRNITIKEKLSQFYIKLTEESGLNNRQVWSIYQDKQQNIWFGTSTGISLLEYEKVQNLYSIIEKTPEEISGFFNSRVFENFSMKHNIFETQVNIINEDSENNIWFGFDGDGIIKYNVQGKTENRFKIFTSRDGLSSDNPVLMIFNSNDMWIGTNKGLDRYDGKKFKNYSKLEGFIGIETNHNAVYKDNEGSLWFGTINGAIKYNPSIDKINSIEPLTHITKLRIFLQDAKMPVGLQLSYQQNHLTFDFIGISLSIPEKVFYQYKLNNFDADWLPITQQTYATYTNLPSGEYTFMVKSCNADNVWNQIPASYNFVITPPFWRTWWFYLLSAVVAFAGVYTFIKLRTRNLEEAKKNLEEKVEQRTSEVVAQKKEIELQNQQLGSAYKEIEIQKNILASKNKHIIESIRYAKSIQEAILPSGIAIQKALPSSFIYYKPKDIVSGDFYWFTKKDDKIIIAVVDCTGHGVPGAFMSVVGNTLINEIVNEKNIILPNEILNNLHEGVRKALHQHEKDSDSRDGMDIALCLIDVGNNHNTSTNPMSMIKKIQYAGANRPLFHVRNNKLKIIKGDKFSIGGYQNEEKQLFSFVDIEIIKGDSIFLFSDGYVDQFGGKFNKKFMTSRFKNLTLAAHSQSTKEQFHIFRKTFEEWKGDKEQVDDILVIGIQF